MDSMDMGGDTSANSTTSSSMSDSMEGMMMKTYLHFTKGDILIFDTVAPSSPGAIFGACIIIFSLSVLERWLRAFRQSLDRRFDDRSIRILTEYGSDVDKLPLSHSPNTSVKPEFMLSHRLSSGALTGVEITLHYLLMLIVMTFNASYIISAIVGAIVGDIAFKRLH